METKSNGKRWRSYVTRDFDRKKIEAYLEDHTSATHYLDLSYLRIPLRSLLCDTDYSKAPTAEWYAIHTCVQDEGKWTQRLTAWGLNRTRLDMYKLQYDILSYIMKKRGRAIEENKNIDMAILPLERIKDIFRRSFQSAAPRFVNAVVPACWHLGSARTIFS